MKKLLLAFVMMISPVSATEFEGIYFNHGIGFKYHSSNPEQDSFDNPTGRWEVYGQWDIESGKIKAGWAHHSDIVRGWPFNEQDEYFKNEFFVDYTVCLFYCNKK